MTLSPNVEVVFVYTTVPPHSVDPTVGSAPLGVPANPSLPVVRATT